MNLFFLDIKVNLVFELKKKFNDLNIFFWIIIKIKPNDTSTAEKIKKKKINDNMFKSSNKNDIIKANIYKLIQKNSEITNDLKFVSNPKIK